MGEGGEAGNCKIVVIADVIAAGDDVVVVDTVAGTIDTVKGVVSDDVAVGVEGCECNAGELLIKVSALGESRKCSVRIAALRTCSGVSVSDERLDGSAGEEGEGIGELDAVGTGA